MRVDMYIYLSGLSITDELSTIDESEITDEKNISINH